MVAIMDKAEHDQLSNAASTKKVFYECPSCKNGGFHFRGTAKLEWEVSGDPGPNRVVVHSCRNCGFVMMHDQEELEHMHPGVRYRP